MSKTLCRICLRCDVVIVDDIEVALAEFHQDLCGNNIDEDENLKYCTICKYQLQKFYNFKQRCRSANNILKSWKIANVPENIENLHQSIPAPSITFQHKNALSKTIEFTHTDIEQEITIKIEQDDTKLEDILESKYYSNEQEIINADNNEVILKLEEDFYDEVYNDDDDDYEPERKKTKSKTIKSSKTRKKEKFKEELSDKLVKKNNKNQLKDKLKLKERVVSLLRNGEFQDLGVTMNEEVFLKMFEKCEKTGLRSMLPLKPDSADERQKLRKFLLYLHKKNNSKYEDIFSVELLDTEDKKLAEFHRRKESKEYKDAEFKCEMCFKVFEVQRLLEYHNRWHEPSTGCNVCDICAMRFATRKALSQHHKTNHCALYRCQLCPMHTYNSAVMVNHYNQHKGMEYSCPVCLSVFSNKNTLNNHRRQAHPTSHVCPHCARTFVSQKGLYFHTRLKHKDECDTVLETGVSCDKCDARLSSEQVLMTHKRQMHAGSQSIHKCFHCKEIFVSLEELKKHKVEKDHQRPRPNKSEESQSTLEGDGARCEECGRTFNSRKSYLRHFNMNHKPNRIHKCGFCGAKFSVASELESHRNQLSHHRKVRYERKIRIQPSQPRLHCNDPQHPTNKCLLCGSLVSAARTNSMYQHFVTSHPDTPYAAVYAQPHNRHLCDQCGKTFKDLTFFLDHKNLHSGLKPYPCGTCPRTFSTRRHLRLHTERHAPPRHMCRDCGKMFNSAANLFAHRRGHIGDRRFKCEICSKGFLHQAALNEHVRGVHHHIRRARKQQDK